MAANIQPIAAVATLGLYSLPMPPNFLEKGSATFVKGNPLILSSGLVDIAGANPTSGILGIATANASGTANTQVGFVAAVPNVIFEISIDGAASNSNAPGTGSLAQSAVGNIYGITEDEASENWYLDTSKSGSNQCVRLIGFQFNAAGTSDAGVVNGRALVVFLGDANIWTAAS